VTVKSVILILQASGNKHRAPRPAVEDDFGAHPSQYFPSNHICFRYGDLNGESPDTKLLQVFVCWVNGLIETDYGQYLFEVAAVGLEPIQ
jgi:hypothetical protein